MIFFLFFDNYVGCVDDSVGHVNGMGSDIFVSIGIESDCDVMMLVASVLVGVDSKCRRLIEIFWRPKS